jgi:hypothetical protein
MSWNWKVNVECDVCHRVIEIEARKPQEVERAMNNRGWVISEKGWDVCDDCQMCCSGCGRSVDECQCEPLGIGEDD